MEATWPAGRLGVPSVRAHSLAGESVPPSIQTLQSRGQANFRPLPALPPSPLFPALVMTVVGVGVARHTSFS